jgi:hypothetical protein
MAVFGYKTSRMCSFVLEVIAHSIQEIYLFPAHYNPVPQTIPNLLIHAQPLPGPNQSPT